MTATVPAPGWYPYGRAGRLAEWDGQAWTGQQKPDESVTAAPWRLRRPWALFARMWWWLLVAGVVLTAVAGIMGSSGAGWWWIALLVVGLLLSLSGIVILFLPLLRFTELRGLPVILGAGLLSGLVALGDC